MKTDRKEDLFEKLRADIEEANKLITEAYTAKEQKFDYPDFSKIYKVIENIRNKLKKKR